MANTMKEAMERRGIKKISQLPEGWIKECEDYYLTPETRQRARAILKERFPELETE